MTGKRFLSAAAAARQLEVDKSTVARWCQRGLVPGAHQPPGGHWRIPAAWVNERVKS